MGGSGLRAEAPTLHEPLLSLQPSLGTPPARPLQWLQLLVVVLELLGRAGLFAQTPRVVLGTGPFQGNFGSQMHRILLNQAWTRLATAPTAPPTPSVKVQIKRGPLGALVFPTVFPYRDYITAFHGGGEALVEGEAFPNWKWQEVKQASFMGPEHHRWGGVTRGRPSCNLPVFSDLLKVVGKGCCTYWTVDYWLDA